MPWGTLKLRPLLAGRSQCVLVACNLLQGLVKMTKSVILSSGLSIIIYNIVILLFSNATASVPGAIWWGRVSEDDAVDWQGAYILCSILANSIIIREGTGLYCLLGPLCLVSTFYYLSGEPTRTQRPGNLKPGICCSWPMSL